VGDQPASGADGGSWGKRLWRGSRSLARHLRGLPPRIRAKYAIRESPALDRVVSALKIPDRDTYRQAVLKLLQDDEAALLELRNLLGVSMPM